MHHRERKPSSTPFSSSYIIITLAVVIIAMSRFTINATSHQRRSVGVVVSGANAFSSFASMNKNQRSIFSSSAVSSRRLAAVAMAPSSQKSGSSKSTLYMWGEERRPPSSSKEGVPPSSRIPRQQFRTADYSSSSSSRPIRPPRRGGGGGASSDDDDGMGRNKAGGKSDWFDDDADDAAFQNNNDSSTTSRVRRGDEDWSTTSTRSYVRTSSDGAGGGDYRGSSRSDDNHRRSYDNNYQQQQQQRGRGESGRGGRGGRGERGRGSDRRGNSFSRGEERSWGRNNDNPRRRSFDREESRRKGRSSGRGSFGSSTTIDINNNLAAVGKINLRAIESAGYEHVYGIAPVLNALKSNVRDFDSSSIDGINDDDRRRFDDINSSLDDDDDDDTIDDDDDNDNDERWRKKKVESSSSSSSTSSIKPEAKLSPHLFVQEGTLNNNNGRTRYNSISTARSDAKKEASLEILSLAKSISLPIIEVDKGVLNSLCGSRPHQGYVLRCGKLDFVAVRRLPKVVMTTMTSATIAATTDSFSTVPETGPSLWLALDEVVDPQNLGALLRSAYFLGGGDTKSINDDNYDDDESALDNNNNGITRGKVGIIVCSKNSSPLSPTVSAASAGAVEFMSIYSTTNLPKLLYTAQEDGWQILGAAADVPDGASRNHHDDKDSIDDNEDDYNEWVMSNEGSDDDDSSNVDNSHAGSSSIAAATTTKLRPQCFDLNDVKTGSPTIIVLGSEGRGLRTLVSRACTGFVRIPGGGGSVLGGSSSSSSIDDDDDKNDDDNENETRSGVDSLNVSVTGGILLWHFLSKQ